MIGVVCAVAAMTVGAAAGARSLELPPLRVEDRMIVDQNGSAVILRGAAVNQLGDYFQANPEVPSTLPLEKADFEQMAAMGMNSVRLVVHWSRLEPEPGVRDREYLGQIKRAVDWARDAGIYVILDMHQDAWGKYIATPVDKKCTWPLSHNIGWDGAPQWATCTDGKTTCKLVQRELSPAVYRAWQAFWEDRDGIQGRLIDTWAWLAAEFKNDPVVAGYDLINEPNWGENYFAAVRKYKPAFYGRAVQAIRGAEEGGIKKIIFFEPIAIWSAIPSEKTVVFTDDPDIVYAPHIYLGSISIDMYFFGKELIPLRKGFELAKKEADAYNTTFYNGEWMPGPGDHGLRMAALEDEFQTGSARWIWKVGCGDPHRLERFYPDTEARNLRESRAVVVLACDDPQAPAGRVTGINPIDEMILSRPYPRAFPPPATFSSDPEKRTLHMEGDAPGEGIPLLVWVPGNGEPVVESEGLDGLSTVKVEGGWLVRAGSRGGSWRLEAAARD